MVKAALDNNFIRYILSIYIIYTNNNHMNTAVINIKTDIKVKKEAQKITTDLGLSLSGVINGFLKQLVRDKAVLFTLNESNPSEYLLSSIKESNAERRTGDFHSFKNNRAAIKFLDSK